MCDVPFNDFDEAGFESRNHQEVRRNRSVRGSHRRFGNFFHKTLLMDSLIVVPSVSEEPVF